MNKLRKDLPAIDLKKKQIKGFFGQTKWVSTSKSEQRKLKKELMKKYPDRYFIDDLNDRNSINPKDKLDWIDELEILDILFDDCI